MRSALRNSLLGLLILAPVAALAGQPATEDATRRALQDAERAQAGQLAARKDADKRSARAAAEAQRLTADRIAAAAKLRQAEAATQAAAIRMDALAASKREAQAHLDARAKAMEPLLPLIERLSLYPTATLLAVPAPPEQTLRGLLVLRGLSHQLEQEARALRQDQATLDAATRALEAEAPKLAAAEAAQAAEAANLDRQIAEAQARRRQAETQAGDAAKHAAEEAAHADSLRSVLAELEAERKAAEARAREAAAKAEREKRLADAAVARRKEAALAHPTGGGTIGQSAHAAGQLVAPVIGVVVRGWGDETDAGPATGVSYHAPPSARVVSPCGGRVVFANQFRSYGLLLIVDCGGDYHVVLAGFDRLDVRVGQTVEAGEPVGVMPAWEPGTAGTRPSLYVELRHDGQPVNPAPWLKANS